MRLIRLDPPSTDLHGSLITGLSRWMDDFVTNQVRRGFLVVLTDGDDRAGLYSTNDVLTARGDKQMFTIGLGNSVNMSVLEAFGNAGSYHVPNIADLPGLFLQIQCSIVNAANRFYWLQYISPKRGNSFYDLNVTITGN